MPDHVSALPEERPTPTPGDRRFNLGDTLILAAAGVLALASSIASLSRLAESFRTIASPVRSIGRLGDLGGWWDGAARQIGAKSWAASGVLELVLCLLVPLAPALVAVELRRRRPAPSGMARRPGFAACVSVCLALTVAANLADLAFVPPPVLAAVPGVAVAAWWLALAVAGRWRPEAGWVDRSGRLVGAVWVALSPLTVWMAL